MLKNKTRRSSATSPNKPAKTARIATDTTRATATARVKTARIATATARVKTARATKVFKPSYMIPLARTVSPNTPTNTGNYPYTATKKQYKTFMQTK